MQAPERAVARERRAGYAMLGVAWLIVFAVGVWFFDGRLRSEQNPNRAAVLGASGSEVVLKRNRSGHYVADGEINGRPVTLMLDTGATQVALPARVADELRLERGAPIRLSTANGTAVGHRTRLDEVRVGPIAVRDVSAVIADGIDDRIVLLGMSFLSRVEFTQRGDNLVLRLP